MKKIFLTIIICLFSIFTVSAEENLDMQDEIKDSNLYESGENVVAEGKYDGIGFVAGADVEVNSNTLFGAVAGQNIRFNGTTTKDLFAAGASITINGVVNRDLYVAGQDVKITGNIDGNIYIASESLIIEETANIKGNIKFYGTKLEVKNAKIEGKLYHYEGIETTGIDNLEIELMKNENTLTIKEKIISVGYSLLRYLFLFLIITFAFPKLLKNIKEKYAFRTIADHLVTAGTGIIAMFLFPVIALLLLISNIGLSVGIILLALYIIFIYITTIVSGYVLGTIITEKVIKKVKNDYLAGLIGITSVLLLTYVPYIGTLVSLISILYGFGIIAKLLTNRENRTI